MPILQLHLLDGAHPEAVVADLALASARLYAEVLDSPLERVRVYTHLHRPQVCVVAGRLVADGAPAAPYFHFLVLQGRPLAQSQALLAGFTDLIVQHLGVDRALVRGGCQPIAPEHWGIAGVPASAVRAGEIQARVDAHGQPPGG